MNVFKILYYKFKMIWFVDLIVIFWLKILLNKYLLIWIGIYRFLRDRYFLFEDRYIFELDKIIIVINLCINIINVFFLLDIYVY